MMQPRMGGIIQANIPDVETLYLSYMPYVVGGGLFVPSKQPVKMGEEIFVLATLPEQSQKFHLQEKSSGFRKSKTASNCRALAFN